MSCRSAIAKRVGLGLACLLVVTSNLGCVTEPTMALHAARVSHVDLSGVGIVVTVAVENDNAFDVLVREVQAEVVLADRFVLPTVTESPNVWLAAHKWTRIDVPVVVPWAQVTPLLQTTASSTEIAYRVRATANVSATRALEITVDRHSIDEQGVVSRAELLAMANRGMRVGG